MKYRVEKKQRSRTGKANLGWILGHGYLHEWMTVKFECWCVTKDGKWFCDARSKKAATDIAEAMERSQK